MRTVAALLACASALGCQPRLIDALEAPDAAADGTADATDGGGAVDAVAADVQPGDAPTGGPLAYYDFNEGTGITVHDRSGNGYDGTLFGGTWTDAGRFGGAISFSAAPDGGVDDWVAVNNFPQAGSQGNGWSVSFWLLAPSEDFTRNNYISVLSTEIPMQLPNPGGWEVDIEPNASDPTVAYLELGFWVTSANWYSTARCLCLQFGSWTHFVAVVDDSVKSDGGGGTIQIFLDGNVAATGTARGPFSLGNPLLYMGRWQPSGRQLQGVLDEVVIYDRPLTATEVRQLNLGIVP
jgi:hypothetical protein